LATAVAVNGPGAAGTTVRVSLVSAPAARSGTAMVTLLPLTVKSFEAVTTVVPAGKVTVTVTPFAGFGPTLVTVKVKVAGEPAWTGSVGARALTATSKSWN